MQNQTHLILSEHNIYHFRWPMPLHLMPEDKRRYIKLSLGTREPQEALCLANGLSYAGKWLVKNRRLQGMEFIEIKKIVQTYFQQLLEQEKARINKDGFDEEQTRMYMRGAQFFLNS